MRKQMKTMEEKNASYMQQTIDLQEVCLCFTMYYLKRLLIIHKENKKIATVAVVLYLIKC